jgi:NCAIR mutase (PurE)-related protein
MNSEQMHRLLEEVRNGTASVEQALEQLSRPSGYVQLQNAHVDTDRRRRRGFPEVIYCESKHADDLLAVVRTLLEHEGRVFGTRCTAEQGAELIAAVGSGHYDPVSRTIRIGEPYERFTDVRTAVLAAGTSDRSVAEEACTTLEFFGAPVDRIYDVGVAGLHRLLNQQERIANAGALIVVAGMEGALASVVSGLFPHPLIAVPTSVGYGASLGGLAALMGMLSSCSSGVTVVNIDNGFGAAMGVLGILRMIEARSRKQEPDE